MKKINVLLLLIFTLAGCSNARQADEVSAIYVPATNYTGLSCTELRTAAESIRARTPALEAAVQSSYSDEKVQEAVGWWLFAPALLFMDGNAEEQAQLAMAKGQLEAIQTAALDCS